MMTEDNPGVLDWSFVSTDWSLYAMSNPLIEGLR